MQTTFPSSTIHPCTRSDPSMEERGPPSTSINVTDGTYVVQVPKDRIYRTPPPENALIAERYRNASAGKPSHSPVKRVLVSMIVFVILLGLVGGIILAMINKDDPRFRVERVRVSTKGKTRQQFDVTLASRNPNAHTSVSFDGHGRTYLSFKDNKFANGKFPSSEQDPKKSKDIRLSLTSPSDAKLPMEVRKSMNGRNTNGSQKGVEMSLEFRVRVKMRVGGLHMKSKTLSMLCRFEVGALAKNYSRILSQECDYSTRL